MEFNTVLTVCSLLLYILRPIYSVPKIKRPKATEIGCFRISDRIQGGGCEFRQHYSSFSSPPAVRCFNPHRVLGHIRIASAPGWSAEVGRETYPVGISVFVTHLHDLVGTVNGSS